MGLTVEVRRYNVLVFMAVRALNGRHDWARLATVFGLRVRTALEAFTKPGADWSFEWHLADMLELACHFAVLALPAAESEG